MLGGSAMNSYSGGASLGASFEGVESERRLASCTTERSNSCCFCCVAAETTPLIGPSLTPANRFQTAAIV